MDINLIKKLIKIVEQSEITEFSVQEGDLKIKISKNSHAGTQAVFQQMPAVIPEMITKVPVTNTIQEEPKLLEPKEEKKSNLHEIRSPIVGTFYRAPAPDADPYVQVGDIVSPGMVLCIVEAMKLMNEIESDVNGKIVKILVENATPVEYNQPLFLIETM
ncbi:MAG: acetyl-CoA carboxylase biotin carboxyl carrier protein [Melioribacter sp.]|uniref:acetyl-CoA carboxylase biotin carboxyl carrier protein n=1 Tax=Rosettibacter primus TaxID=3111523 RepID=UPI00247B8344|nr:acetyl-CoA carboxylase biotin carboxyl carrier protein [Melioribacter sp.]